MLNIEDIKSKILTCEMQMEKARRKDDWNKVSFQQGKATVYSEILEELESHRRISKPIDSIAQTIHSLDEEDHY